MDRLEANDPNLQQPSPAWALQNEAMQERLTRQQLSNARPSGDLYSYYQQPAPADTGHFQWASTPGSTYIFYNFNYNGPEQGYQPRFVQSYCQPGYDRGYNQPPYIQNCQPGYERNYYQPGYAQNFYHPGLAQQFYQPGFAQPYAGLTGQYRDPHPILHRMERALGIGPYASVYPNYGMYNAMANPYMYGPQMPYQSFNSYYPAPPGPVIYPGNNLGAYPRMTCAYTYGYGYNPMGSSLVAGAMLGLLASGLRRHH